MEPHTHRNAHKLLIFHFLASASAQFSGTTAVQVRMEHFRNGAHCVARGGCVDRLLVHTVNGIWTRSTDTRSSWPHSNEPIRLVLLRSSMKILPHSSAEAAGNWFLSQITGLCNERSSDLLEAVHWRYWTILLRSSSLALTVALHQRHSSVHLFGSSGFKSREITRWLFSVWKPPDRSSQSPIIAQAKLIICRTSRLN